MKPTTTPHLNRFLLLTTATLAVSAQAGIIDDFSVPGLSEYTQTAVLDNGIAESNVTFSDASGSLVASYGGTVSQPEQVLLLRNDFSLPIGSFLMADVAFPVQTSQMDFGIAISSTATPTGVAGATTDTRATFNWAAVYVRPSQDAVRNTSSINGTLVSGTGVATAVETTVSSLYIERVSATDFTLGYYDTGSVRHDIRSITFTATDVGTAVGFYGDLRAVGGSLGSLDNLRTVPVPEPASLGLLAVGGGALALLARRRRTV
jgi:hypothetical protein